MTRAFAYADGREADQARPARGRGSRRRDRLDSRGGCPAAPRHRHRRAQPPAPAVAGAARRRPPRQRRAMDPQLHEIYSKEISSHLAEIRDYLRKRAGLPAPHELPESVYRAIHTLSGSSKMAEARHGIRITEPLNHYMRKVFDSGHGLSDAALVGARGRGSLHRQRRIAHQRVDRVLRRATLAPRAAAGARGRARRRARDRHRDERIARSSRSWQRRSRRRRPQRPHRHRLRKRRRRPLPRRRRRRPPRRNSITRSRISTARRRPS